MPCPASSFCDLGWVQFADGDPRWLARLVRHLPGLAQDGGFLRCHFTVDYRGSCTISEPGLQKESLGSSQYVHIAVEDTRKSSVAAGRDAVAMTPGTTYV